MSTAAVASGGGRSTLNPNAPLFIPAALQRVEDFSPEWWELVKTTPWFRDHWFRQHQEQETFDGNEEEEDVANLLPDSFDLGIDDDFSDFVADFEEQEAYMEAMQQVYYPVQASVNKENGLEMEAESLMKKLSLKSPKNGVTKPVLDPARYKEKPAMVASPRSSFRRIQQPR
ncbi:hypothetical protein HPP92_014175 [Vanilla planifolia]|uniref:Uncharacterized protein n=1 Tax=Vanilla planifolia TaxID=51239 RepID=A0A835QRE7_VANPL|nr:hypothetical protein HPP92_014175 [Vanilla planifolia]